MAAYARQSGEENAPPIQIQAQPRLRRIFGFRLTPARWFLITSLCILILGMTVIGWWIAWQIERNVVERSAFATALYVDSLLLPPLQELATSKHISPATIRQLETLLTETSLGMEIASFKVWDAQGRVMYSTNPTLIDRIFPISSGLQAALRGNVHAELSDLEEAEHVVERQHADRLLEIYSPVRAHGSGDVLAVVEYYHRVDDLEATIRSAQQQGWLVIIAVTSLMYLALSGFVYRASRTIVRQDGELRKQVRHLTDLIAQNRDLHERVQRAAARSTAHHERYLRRIGADLHDGPAQYLGAALLHVDRISMISETSAPKLTGDLDRVRGLLDHAMQEVREISAGLGIPQIEALSLDAIISRVTRTHEQVTGTSVHVTRPANLPDVCLSTKITVYRLAQEALNNAFQHAGGLGQHITIMGDQQRLIIRIADQGPGFRPPEQKDWTRQLGLSGMRERVESLGGEFTIDSRPSRGTVIIASLPCHTSQDVL